MIRFYFFISIINIFIVNIQTDHKSDKKVSILPDKKIELFDGKGLSSWTFFTTDPKVSVDSICFVDKEVIVCQGKPNGYIRTVTVTLKRFFKGSDILLV